jgi:hypothetical protein
MDIYKIPQPVPVDITYSVKIICNRMRELNAFNKVVLEKFASKQAYQVIKGHYIPIVMGNITDESELTIEKRKFYIQTYEFTMLGFLIDEDEFEVSPAINRLLQVVELDKGVSRKQKKINNNPASTNLDVLFVVGNSLISQRFDYTVNLNLGETSNVKNFEVYINNLYYGENVGIIQVNTGDVIKIEITKNDDSLESKIQFNNLLL